MYSVKRTRVRSRAFGALTALCLMTGSGLLAQSTTQTTPPPAPSTTAPVSSDAVVATSDEPANQEKAVTLDPFSVTADTEGYQAVDTLGGARVATSLKDTPSAIQVVTKQFLADTGATSAQDLLVYTTDTEVAGLNGNYSGVSSRGVGVSNNAEAGRLLNPNNDDRARGLTAMDNTRNYFVSDIPWDSYDIDRIDISRGPNSFLYGVGSPSGISNYSTIQAMFKDEGNVEARTGSFGSTRVSLDYNKQIIPGELAVRIALLDDDTQYQQKPAFNHQERAYAALRFDPKALNNELSHLKISLNGEVGAVRSNNPRELPPLDYITGYFAGQGLNKAGYDPFIYANNSPAITEITGVGSFVGNSPWLNNSDIHYLWPGPGAAYIYNGATGQLLNSLTTTNGGNIAGGVALTSPPFTQASPLYTSGFANYAKTVNYNNPALYPGAYSGTVTYSDKSLTDPSIFNYYDNLIDGDNKQEWQNWKAFNATAEETLLGGRIAIQAVVDHQDFTEGQSTIFGYTQPYISVDLDNILIEYPSSSGNAVLNPNEGRPFVGGDFSNGDNSVHTVRDNYQITANGELRAEDLGLKGLLGKIFGRHSLTLLVSEDRTNTDSRTWDGDATDTNFAAEMLATSGVNVGTNINDRGIDWVTYLGPSLVNDASGSGLNLSRIVNQIQPVSGSITTLNSTSSATQTGYSYTQVPVDVLNWHDDQNQLWTSGNKTLEELKSVAVMYQGHLLDDIIVPEFGVRRDEVSQNSANAPLDPTTAVASMNYGITGSPITNITDSTSWGVTLHLPKDIQRQLPLDSDVSVYYFHGNNETPKIRYAFDSSVLPNEAGKTDDYGVQLDTLNGHATFRITAFKTQDNNAAAGSGAADPLGGNGYYLYLLPAWGAGDAALDALDLGGSTASGGFGIGSAGTATTEAAAIADWKANFAKFFPQNFFDAYGLGVNVGAISQGNWANVYNNPNQVNFPWNIANTGGGRINGSFPIITQDVESKGFELEATIRPVANWDITFNASKVNATQTALGAQDSAFIMNEYKFFNGPAGQLPLWGYWGGAGGGTSTLQSYFLQNIYSAYLLQEAQTGTEQPELAQWNFKAITNYTFRRGWAKGINIGGGFRWQSKPILGYGITEVTDSSGDQTWEMDAHKPIYGEIEEHADAWIGYQHRLSQALDWRIQLNVKNVGEKAHLVPVSVEPDGTVADERISEGMEFTLSSKIMF